MPLQVDKETKKELRENALEEHRRSESNKKKISDDLKHDLKSFGVKQQIKVTASSTFIDEMNDLSIFSMFYFY